MQSQYTSSSRSTFEIVFDDSKTIYPSPPIPRRPTQADLTRYSPQEAIARPYQAPPTQPTQPPLTFPQVEVTPFAPTFLPPSIPTLPPSIPMPPPTLQPSEPSRLVELPRPPPPEEIGVSPPRVEERKIEVKGPVKGLIFRDEPREPESNLWSEIVYEEDKTYLDRCGPRDKTSPRNLAPLIRELDTAHALFPMTPEEMKRAAREHRTHLGVMPIQLQEAEPLSDILKQGRDINVDTLSKWTEDVITQVLQLHKKGICHCNISPRAFFLDAENRLRLGDFRYVKLLSAINKGLPYPVNPEYRLPLDLWNETGPSTYYKLRTADLWACGLVIADLIGMYLNTKHQRFPFTWGSGPPPANLMAIIEKKGKITPAVKLVVDALALELKDPTLSMYGGTAKAVWPKIWNVSDSKLIDQSRLEEKKLRTILLIPQVLLANPNSQCTTNEVQSYFQKATGWSVPAPIVPVPGESESVDDLFYTLSNVNYDPTERVEPVVAVPEGLTPEETKFLDFIRSTPALSRSQSSLDIKRLWDSINKYARVWGVTREEATARVAAWLLGEDFVEMVPPRTAPQVLRSVQQHLS